MLSYINNYPYKRIDFCLCVHILWLNKLRCDCLHPSFPGNHFEAPTISIALCCVVDSLTYSNMCADIVTNMEVEVIKEAPKESMG